MKILDDSSLKYINGGGIAPRAVGAILQHNPHVNFLAQYPAQVLNPSTQQNGIGVGGNALRIPTLQARPNH